MGGITGRCGGWILGSFCLTGVYPFCLFLSFKIFLFGYFYFTFENCFAFSLFFLIFGFSAC
jgi:hypothetical protein